MYNQKKHAIVTGGSSGIGRAIVQLLYDRGDHVAIFDRLPPQDLHVTDRMRYYHIDLSSIEDLNRGFDLFQKQLEQDNQSLDILVNCAGITRDRMSARVTPDDWDAVMNINLKAAFFVTQRALRLMASKKLTSRYIIMLSSLVGHTGNVGQAVYAASKAGLLALTKSLAREYASRAILINAIAPGLVDTAMTQALPQEYLATVLKSIPLNRAAQPEEIAQCVAFLTSGNADYITGQTIDVNGGMIMR